MAELYSKSIKMSEKSGYLSEEGLSRELSAKYHKQLFEHYTRQAAQEYTKYGAMSKREILVCISPIIVIFLQISKEKGDTLGTANQRTFKETAYFSSIETDLEVSIYHVFFLLFFRLLYLLLKN